MNDTTIQGARMEPFIMQHGGSVLQFVGTLIVAIIAARMTARKIGAESKQDSIDFERASLAAEIADRAAFRADQQREINELRNQLVECHNQHAAAQREILSLRSELMDLRGRLKILEDKNGS